MRSLLLSGIVKSRVQMRVKGGLENFGKKQGCVYRDLLSTVVEMNPLVWGLREPMAAERRMYQGARRISHYTWTVK